MKKGQLFYSVQNEFQNYEDLDFNFGKIFNLKYFSLLVGLNYMIDVSIFGVKQVFNKLIILVNDIELKLDMRGGLLGM